MSTTEGRSKRYVLGLTVFMGFIGLLDQYTSLVEGRLLNDYILVEFSMAASDFAFWQGLFGIMTFAVFFIAWFSDAYGRKKGILLLMLIMGVADLLIVFTTGNFFLFMFFYSLAIMGTLSNLWEIPITEEAPAANRGMYGSLAFFIGLIPIYAFIADDIANAIGWRWAYGIMFILMLILLIPWYFMKEPERWIDAHKERGSKALKIKTAIQSLTKTDLMYIVMCSIIYGLWTVSFKMGATFASTDPKLASIYDSILTVGGLLTLVGAIICAISMDKLGRNATLVIGCVGSVTGFFILAIPVTNIAKIGFWMVYLFMPILMGWIMIYFSEIFPTKTRSTTVGITTTAARLSYVIGPLISWIILSTTNHNYSIFWIMAGIFMIIPLLSLLIKPYETKGKVLEDVQKER